MIFVITETADVSRKVLIVDDNADQGRPLALILRHSGYEAQFVTSGEAALVQVREEPVGLMIVDMMMPGMTGSKCSVTSATIRRRRASRSSFTAPATKSARWPSAATPARTTTGSRSRCARRNLPPHRGLLRSRR